MKYDVSITLTDKNAGTSDTSWARQIDDPRHFFYVDPYDCQVEVFADEEGLTVFRQGEDHLTELFFRERSYVKVTSEEGSFQFDAKVLAFERNDDILMLRYVLDEDVRQIVIKFFGSE